MVVNVVLISPDPGFKCLDVAGGLAQVGENVQVYPCHNGLISSFTMALDAGSATDWWVRQKIVAEFTRQDWAFQPAGTGNRL
jgi:hypothetical protein